SPRASPDRASRTAPAPRPPTRTPRLPPPPARDKTPRAPRTPAALHSPSLHPSPPIGLAAGAHHVCASHATTTAGTANRPDSSMVVGGQPLWLRGPSQARREQSAASRAVLRHTQGPGSGRTTVEAVSKHRDRRVPSLV